MEKRVRSTKEQEKRRQTSLSPRLKAIAAMVEEGGCLADVGTDHGYLPIRLLEEGRISSAIAMDINEGPLLRAKAHVEERRLSAKIQLRRSDGFSDLAPGEADVAVIAGMGGPLTVRILENGRETADSLDYLVLSPQSELAMVRGYLLGHGYRILDEDMVCDEGKYYTILKAAYKRQSCGQDKETPWNYIETCYGRHLLRSGKQVVLEFLLKEKRTGEAVREQLLRSETPKARERLSQVEKEMEAISAAIAIIEKAAGKGE